MKKFLSILLAAALLLGLGTVGAGALTNEEVLEQFMDSLIKAFSVLHIKMLIVSQDSLPLVLLYILDDPSGCLKDGVDPEDVKQAFTEMVDGIDWGGAGTRNAGGRVCAPRP